MKLLPLLLFTPFLLFGATLTPKERYEQRQGISPKVKSGEKAAELVNLKIDSKYFFDISRSILGLGF
jgi:hypothetical protein